MDVLDLHIGGENDRPVDAENRGVVPGPERHHAAESDPGLEHALDDLRFLHGLSELGGDRG